MMQKTEYFSSEGFRKSVSDLSQKASLSTKFSLKPLDGGRNNKLFCVIYNDGAKALLKAYFHHPNDARNRIKAEYLFLNFAWNNKVYCVPKPIAADFQNYLALYEFIDGRKLFPNEINEEKIGQALNFFIGINKYKSDGLKDLPIASEACFSIKEHINCVGNRIKKLKKIDDFTEINHKAIHFVEDDLSKAWGNAIKHVEESIQKYDLNFEEVLSPKDRCISPSDFGYHNSLLNKANKLIFIDFEYAGWDDPAKMVCDFFCQPDVPVPIKYFDTFVKRVVETTKDPKKTEYRIRALLPVYKIKWCCILLNEFLEIGSERRNFAYGASDLEQQKIVQLEKVRKYLESNKF